MLLEVRGVVYFRVVSGDWTAELTIVKNDLSYLNFLDNEILSFFDIV